MNFSNPIPDVSQALYSSCIRDLPDIEYAAFTPRMLREGKTPFEAPKKLRRPEPYDLNEVHLWQQTWGSTALGFGGMGGASITTANVVVIIGPSRAAAVYFGGRFAYLIERPNARFRDDVKMRQLADVAGAKSLYEERGAL